MKSQLLYLSPEHIRRALPMPEAIAAMREAFVQLSGGQVTLPSRQRLEAPEDKGVALVMTCHSATQKLFGLKFITLFDQNRHKGLPLIQAFVVLADGQTGTPLAILDGSALTAIRTGAASGAATDALARHDAPVAAVFGAGAQARTQLEAVSCVRTLRHAWVYDPNAQAAERFAAEMTNLLGFPIERAADPDEAVASADVICTATTSPNPVFEDSSLKPGVHINAVGSYHPTVSEIPAETICRARVIVDHRASALEEAGDLLGPLQKGLIQESHFQTELGQVLSHQATGRQTAEEITLFKSVGVAIQDLCAAARALENARKLNLGTIL